MKFPLLTIVFLSMLSGQELADTSITDDSNLNFEQNEIDTTLVTVVKESLHFFFLWFLFRSIIAIFLFRFCFTCIIR